LFGRAQLAPIALKQTLGFEQQNFTLGIQKPRLLVTLPPPLGSDFEPGPQPQKFALLEQMLEEARPRPDDGLMRQLDLGL